MSAPVESPALVIIRDTIAAEGGWIPFSRYMDLALYAPGAGYYAHGRQQFGAAGDFVTASGISGLFGASLARQVAQITEASAPHVLEFGAGNGQLAADLLNALGDGVLHYEILELSPALRDLQRETIARKSPGHADRVTWRDTLPQRFSGCIVANEVLDAMPVHLMAWSHAGLFERGVEMSGAKLAFADHPATGRVAEAASALVSSRSIVPPYVSEINLTAMAWTRSLAGFLEAGAALLIDYGFPAREYYHPQRSCGTLMCHHQHRASDDPLVLPGAADITAHVDFSSVAKAGIDAGLDMLGYATQAGFLIDCGITDLLAATSVSDTLAYMSLANQANRLLSPAEMGELFKVLALGRGIDDSLLGFARSDRRQAL
jgi:SAM-dependent MidA family methyltransferase